MNCIIDKNQPIYQALLDKANSYPSNRSVQAKTYQNAARSIARYHTNIYKEFSIYDGFDIRPDYVGPRIEEFIKDFIKTNSTSNEMGTKADKVNPTAYTKYGATLADYQTLSATIKSHFPDAKPDMLDKRIDYAFKTNLWKYVINPCSYDEIEGDDDGYSSDATEYCQVRGGVRCIIPAAGSEAIHRLVVNLFKNDDWMEIAFGASPPKDL